MNEVFLASVVLPLVAAATHALGFWKYNSQAKDGSSQPNFVTWAINVLLATLNALSFMAITSFVIAATPFVGAVGCIVTFVHVLATGKFKWPGWKEWSILIIGILTVVVWKFYGPLSGNLVLIVAIILSFWPTWEGVWKDPAKEKALAWILWGSAYTLTMFATILTNGLNLKLTMPLILVFAHLAVPAVCVYRKEQR